MYYQFDQYLVDKENHKLYCDDEIISDDEKTANLLSLLCENSPELVSKQVLLDALWPDQVVSDWSLSKLVSDVRQLLGDSGKDQGYIRTIRGRGFRFNSKLRAYKDTSSITIKPTIKPPVPRKSKPRQLKIAATVGTVLLLIVSYYFLPTSTKINTDQNQPIRVAVLPILNEETDNPVDDWIKYGVMSMVTEQLSSYKTLQTLPVATVINLAAQLNYQTVDSSLFEKICGQIGCSHLVVIKHHYGPNSNPVLTIKFSRITTARQFSIFLSLILLIRRICY